MEKIRIGQLRGLSELVADALDAGLVRSEEIHRSIAKHPYAALARISPLAAPVRTVEFVETAITGSVYWTVRMAARVSGIVASRVLEHLDARASRGIDNAG